MKFILCGLSVQTLFGGTAQRVLILLELAYLHIDLSQIALTLCFLALLHLRSALQETFHQMSHDFFSWKVCLKVTSPMPLCAEESSVSCVFGQSHS